MSEIPDNPIDMMAELFREIEKLEKQIKEAREEKQYSNLEREWLLNRLYAMSPMHTMDDLKCLLANGVEDKIKQLKEQGE